MSKRAIILPYKESFDDTNSGAASIFVKETLANENIEDFIIYGSNSKINKKYKKRFFYNPNKKKFFTNYNYIEYFIKKFSKIKFDTIEIHNRPEYIYKIKKYFPTSKIIFYFHNNPDTLRGSKTYKQKKFIYENCQIIFLSKWIKLQFEKNDFAKKSNIVIYPGVKQEKYHKKEKIIFFCGKLNHSKGYDIFLEATKKFKENKKYSEWKIISAGSEPRRSISSEKHIKELGQISHKKVYEIYKKSTISIAPSKWQEPLGRLPIESSAHGCIPVTSSNGGLPETNHDGFILKNNTASELYKLLISILSDNKKINKLSLKVYKNFKYNNENFLDSISKIRNNKKNFKKIFLISNLNIKNKQRLFYSFFNKLNIGLNKLAFKTITLSDRDYIRENRKIFDPTGRRSFNRAIISKLKSFKPDLIILGHVDKIDIKTLREIRLINQDIKIIKFFIDSIADEFFNFKKIFYDYNYLDNIFISSNPFKLKKYDIFNKIKFIPYPAEKKIDYMKSFNFNKKKIDVFFALSHGQNRKVLKVNKTDEREVFLKKVLKLLPKNIKTFFVGTNNIQPIWGTKFYNTIKISKIAINLSRGSYKKHYSSDRISTLIGNGCFVLNEKKNSYSDFFNKKTELINFENEKDLVKKIIYYLKKPKLRYKIASNSYKKYHNNFNINTVMKYVLKILNKEDIKSKFIWT